MAKTESHYSRINDAEEIIQDLCDKYADVFWAVKPEMIIVMGVDNKTRSEAQKKKVPYFTKLKAIKGSEKALLIDNNIPSRYIIETYWDEWNDWKESRKQVMLSNELIKITVDVGKTNSYDCAGFKILISEFGVNWNVSDTNLKDMLINDIDFDLDLRPGLDTEESETDEIEDPKEEAEEAEEAKEEVVEVEDYKTMDEEGDEDGDGEETPDDPDANPFE